MPSTKTLSTLIPAGTSNAAGGTTTGTNLGLTTSYGATVTIKLTNGATAPTIAATAKVLISGNGTDFKLFYQVAGDLVINSVNEFAIDIPLPVMNVNVVVTGNTGQAVVCEAFAQVATGI